MCYEEHCFGCKAIPLSDLYFIMFLFISIIVSEYIMNSLYPYLCLFSTDHQKRPGAGCCCEYSCLVHKNDHSQVLSVNKMIITIKCAFKECGTVGGLSDDTKETGVLNVGTIRFNVLNTM